jgi:hypothetical protein
MKKVHLVVFAGFALFSFASCQKESPMSAPTAGMRAVQLTHLWNDRNAGELIYQASPALYDALSDPAKTSLPDVHKVKGMLVGIGAPPENEPICSKNSCTNCVCCYEVIDYGPSLNSGNGTGNFNILEEGLEGFNAFNATSDPKLLIIADNEPNLDNVQKVIAEDTGDGLIHLHIQK